MISKQLRHNPGAAIGTKTNQHKPQNNCKG